MPRGRCRRIGTAPRVAQSAAQLKVLAPVRGESGRGRALHPRCVRQDEVDDAAGVIQREVVAVEGVRHAGIAEDFDGPSCAPVAFGEDIAVLRRGHQFVAVADHVQDRDMAGGKRRHFADRLPLKRSICSAERL